MCGFLFASTGLATTVRVVSTEAEKTGVWAEALVNDISGALSSAGANGTVLVKPGTYPISATVQTLSGGQVLRSDDGEGNVAPETTILDGSSLSEGPILRATSKKGFVIEGLTFRKGCNGCEQGGAMRLESMGSSVIRSCIFRDNGAVSGGALYMCDSVGCVITNCQFIGNVAKSESARAFGGAIYDQQWYDDADHYMTIVDCTFTENVASGTYNASGSSVASGGAIFGMHKVFVDGCTFSGNYSEGPGTTISRGGAICAGKNAVIRNSTFVGSAYAQYGALIDNGADGMIAGCTFDAVKQVTDRGTVYGLLHPSGASLVADCIVAKCTGNTAFVFAESNDGIRLRNNLVYGGSIALIRGFNLKAAYVDHCTFTGNAVAAIVNPWNYSTNLVSNSIIEGPVASGGDKDYVRFTNTFLTQSWGTDEPNCRYGQDPGFRNVPRLDYHIRADSVCLDAGAGLSWTPEGKDLDGKPRTVGTAPDLGCFERQVDEEDPDYRVRVVASEKDRTGAWANAYVGVAAAVDAAIEGDVILMKEGVYHPVEPVKVTNRSLAFTCDGAVVWDGEGVRRCLVAVLTAGGHALAFDGITFRNGYSGNDYSADNFYAHGGGVYVSCNQASGRISMKNCVIEDCHTCYDFSQGLKKNLARGGGIYAEYYCTLDGCTIRNCAATNGLGGGVCVSSPTLTANRQTGLAVVNCEVRENETAGVYSGDYSNDGPAGAGGLASLYACWVENCDFVRNVSVATNARESTWFGALHAGASSRILSCRFDGNSASYGGAAGFGENVQYSNCTFTANASSYGVAFGLKSSTRFESCVFTNNNADCYAAVSAMPSFRNCLFANPGRTACHVIMGHGVLSAENCTFVKNNTAVAVDGLSGSRATVALVNCLFNGNTADFTRGDGAASEVTFALTNCCATAFPAAHVDLHDCLVSDRPGFVDAAAGDYRLRPSSRCREKGLLLDWMTGSAVDLAGIPRVIDGGVKTLAENPAALPEIGCYECYGLPPGLSVIVR